MKQLLGPKCDYKIYLGEGGLLFLFHIWTTVAGLMSETQWIIDMKFV